MSFLGKVTFCLLMLFSSACLALGVLGNIYAKHDDEKINEYVAEVLESIESPFDEVGDLRLSVLKSRDRTKKIDKLSKVLDYAISNGSKIACAPTVVFENGLYKVPMKSKMLTLDLLMGRVWRQGSLSSMKRDLALLGFSVEGYEIMEGIINGDDSRERILKMMLASLGPLEKKVVLLTSGALRHEIETYNTRVQEYEDDVYFERSLNLLLSLSENDQDVLVDYLFDTSGVGVIFIPSGPVGKSIDELGNAVKSGRLRNNLMGELRVEEKS